MRLFIVLLLCAAYCQAQEIQVTPMAVSVPPVVASESFAFIDSLADSTTINGHTPYSFPYTAHTNTKGFLGLWISSQYVDTVVSVTFNDVAMTKLGTWYGDVRFFGLVNPSAGAHNFVVNYGDADIWGVHISFGVVEFTGVDQSTPTGSFAFATGETSPGSGDFSLNVSSGTGQIVVGMARGGSQAVATTESIVARVVSADDYLAQLCAVRDAGAETTTLSFSTSDQWKTWYAFGVSVRPAP